MLNMLFLYFPEDKSEYIPALIVLSLFMAVAVFTLYLVVKKSKKDESTFNQQYAEQLKQSEEMREDHQHS